MRINIIGCGPTGMSVAWSLSKLQYLDIHIFDKKDGPGGSWWEPASGERDVHASRILFPHAYVNVQSILHEMGLCWDDYFHIEKNNKIEILYKLSWGDYLEVSLLAVKVLLKPNEYKSKTLRESLNTTKLSHTGKELFSKLPLILDGVDWNVMTAWEFVEGFNFVGLGAIKPHTQSKSGYYLNHDMMNKLKERGVKFHFNKDVNDIQYNSDGTYEVSIGNEMRISGGLLVICIDPGPAMRLVKDNWGPGTRKILADSIYGSISLILEYDSPIDLGGHSIDKFMETSWGIIPSLLDPQTLSCVITQPLDVSPDKLEQEIIKQLKVPPPKRCRVCWGSRWVDDHWEYDQTAMSYPIGGTLSFFGKSPSVAMCGMMSERRCPFASMEAAIEVGRIFTHRYFGCPAPTYKYTISTKILIVLLIIIYIRYVRVFIKNNLRTG